MSRKQAIEQIIGFIEQQEEIKDSIQEIMFVMMVRISGEYFAEMNRIMKKTDQGYEIKVPMALTCMIGIMESCIKDLKDWRALVIKANKKEIKK